MRFDTKIKYCLYDIENKKVDGWFESFDNLCLKWLSKTQMTMFCPKIVIEFFVNKQKCTVETELWELLQPLVEEHSYEHKKSEDYRKYKSLFELSFYSFMTKEANEEYQYLMKRINEESIDKEELKNLVRNLCLRNDRNDL